jgi:hypothetical protein
MSGALDKAGALLDTVRQAALMRLWHRSSAAFLYGAPFITVDENDNDALKPIPERDDLRWILGRLDTVVSDEPEDQIIWKSRQHFATHAVHGNNIWLAAEHPHVSVAYVAQEEQEGKDHLEEKVVGAWERMPPWYRDRFKWNLRNGIFVLEERDGQPWRSFIEPIARGSRKLRSWTYRRIVFDEAAHNDLLKASFVGAHATTRGARNPKTGKMKKGQIVLLSSASYHEFMIELSGGALPAALELAWEEVA